MVFSQINSMLYSVAFHEINVFAQRAYLAIARRVKACRQFKTFFGDTITGDIGDYIQSRLFSFGIWEPNLTRFVQSKIKEDTWAIDVGAHVGYFSLMIARLAPKGHVTAIEASPTTYAMLRDHLRINRRWNIDAINKAVAEQPGEVRLYNSKHGAKNTGNNSLLAPKTPTSYATVEADTLMNIIGVNSHRVSFIKIDIEGAERPVLNEILSNVDRFASNLTVVAEVSDANLDLVDRFISAGFRCYVLENNYDLDAYLAKRTADPKPWAGTRPSGADLIFER